MIWSKSEPWIFPSPEMTSSLVLELPKVHVDLEIIYLRGILITFETLYIATND